MQNLTVSENLIDKNIAVPFVQVSVKTWFLVLTFAVAGFAVPTIYGYIFGFPVAHVQDELSYTVAADTYAHGKLTNPTPAHFEHFEVAHVLMEPSYISKYPPLQGMFMALGQVVFGQQIFGVWLSCGFFAAALFLMLSVWTKREWAIVGTISAILFLGINSYWAQSYWGGMIAAAGGALFFGGFRQFFNDFKASSIILMVVGGIVLVNSRPFEGTVIMIPSLIFLLVWLIRDKNLQFSQKLGRVVLPGMLVAGIAISAMGYQYYRVTGSPFTLPYSVHHAQYYPTPLFSFQPINHSATKGNPRIREVFESYTIPPVLESMLGMGLPDSTVLRSVYGFFYLNFALPFFFFSPVLLMLFYFAVPIALKQNRWLWLIVGSILFTFFCMSFGVWWDQYHYAAPLTACFFLLIAEGFRCFFESGKDNLQRKRVFLTFFCLILGSVIYLQLFSYKQPQMKKDFSADRALLTEGLSTNTKVKIDLPRKATFFKDEMEKVVEGLPDRYIAIVSYAPNYDFHDEIIFNKADIENAKMVWAHDLGAEKNKSLLGYYNNRKVLHVKIDGGGIEIEPVNSN